MADVARLRIIYEADTSAFDKAHSRVEKQTQAFSKEASKAGKVKIEADTSDFDKGISGSTDHVRQLSKVTQKVDVNVDKDGRASAAAAKLNTGFGELSSSIRQFKTVATATTLAPGLIAGIGGLPALATAGAGAVGQLGIALGQGLAGGAAIAGTAFAGAKVGLLAYNAAIRRTISDSREAYAATHEQAIAQLEQQRNTILNTKASVAFNEQLNRSAIALTRVEAKIGSRVFPLFTKEIQAWTNILPKFQGDIVDTSGALAKMATNFSKFVRTSNGGQNLRRTIDFINQSAINAGGTLQHLGRAGFRVFQLLIPPALKLQKQILSLAGAVDKWTQKSDNMRRVSGILDLLQHRFYQLVNTVRDFGVGIINVFRALNATGGPTRLMNGLEGLAAGFRHIMSDSGRGQAAIRRFMGYSQPALEQTWKLVKTVVVQFGLLANNVAKAGQQGNKMGILAQVIKGIRESIVPLRKMFQNTFIALGPVLADLIPEAAKFLSVFLGSSGPLKAFLRAVTGILRVFNRLPDGVQTAVVNLVALKAILGGMGVGAFAGSMGRLATQVYTLRTASNAAKKSQIALAAAQGETAAATTAAGGATAAAGGRFGRFGAVVKGAGVWLLRFARFAGPVALVLGTLATGAIIVYKNWDRISKAIRPALTGFRKFGDVIRPLVGGVLRSLGKALSSMARGFLSTISPSKRLGGQVKDLSGVFGNLAKRAIPPVRSALLKLGNWISSHQGLFRALGKIIGTVVVGGFRIWWKVLQGGYVIIRTIVRLIGTIINAGKRLVSSWRNTNKETKASLSGMGKAVRGFVTNAFRAIVNFGRDAYNFWRNKIWNPISKFLSNTASDMSKRLGKWKNDTVHFVLSLVGAVFGPWKSKIWNPISKFLSNTASNMSSRLGKWKNDTVGWVKSLWGAVARPFGKVFDSMLKKLRDIASSIKTTLTNLVDGIKSAFSSMGNFASDVLQKLGLKDDKSPIPSPKVTKGTINAPGGGYNRPGAATGALIKKRQTIDVAEDGPEYVINPRKRGNVGLLKSAAEDMGYSVIPSSDAGPHSHEDAGLGPAVNGIRRPRDTRPFSARQARPGGMWGHGYSVSPITHYKWAPEIKERVYDIAHATGTKPNTYPGHGEPGGSSELYTADFWGPGGRGSHISRSAGYRTAELALEKYNHDPGVLYMLRQGQYWRGGKWSGNTYGDPHYDHTHISWDSPGGASASGGGVSSAPVPNPKQAKFEKMWDAVIGPWGKRFVPNMSNRTQYHRGSGAGTTMSATKIYDWIDEQIPDMIGGSGVSSSGNSPKGLTLLEAAEGGGFSGDNAKHAAAIIYRESGGNAAAAPRELGGKGSYYKDSNYAAGDPSIGLMQIIGSYGKQVLGTSSLHEAQKRMMDPITNTKVGNHLFKSQGWSPWATAAGWSQGLSHIHDKVINYGRGGITLGRKGLNLNLPGRVQKAFHMVADTLRDMAGKRGGRHIDRGRGRITRGVTEIAGEAGREAIVPLERRTPEGMHALREANRRHKIFSPSGNRLAHGVGYFGKAHPLGTTLGGGVPRAGRAQGGHGLSRDRREDRDRREGRDNAFRPGRGDVDVRPNRHGRRRAHGSQGHGGRNDSAESILHDIRQEIVKLRKDGFTLKDREALLEMADRYQGSPQGKRRWDTNMDRFSKKDLKKLGAR